MKAAIGYIRVSSEEQTESGLSIEAQEAKIRAYCTLHDLELDRILRDDQSAKNLKRPAIQELLGLVRARKAGAVLVVGKLDRLTRSVRDLCELIDTFARAKLELASVAEQLNTATAAGRMVVHMLGVIAQWERETIGERTSDAMAVKRARGERVSRHPPYGWRHEGTALVSDSQEQKGITLAVELRRRGASYGEIAERLNFFGYRRHGRQLSRQCISNVLRRSVPCH